MYLQRLKVRPSVEDLTPAEARFVQSHFDPYAGEVLVNGDSIAWNEIEEIEIAMAPRVAGPAGWVVRHLIHGDERYHVGIYFGRNEAVLPNVSLNVAQYVVKSIAFYAPSPVRYNGPEGLFTLADE
jgi:hypothetical protein